MYNTANSLFMRPALVQLPPNEEGSSLSNITTAQLRISGGLLFVGGETMPEIRLEFRPALVKGECVSKVSDCVVRGGERQASGDNEANRGHLHWSSYTPPGSIEVSYCVPYSYEFDLDDARKGVAKVDRVLQI
jgi:hypothetical protein